MENTVIKRYC